MTEIIPVKYEWQKLIREEIREEIREKELAEIRKKKGRSL